MYVQMEHSKKFPVILCVSVLTYRKKKKDGSKDGKRPISNDGKEKGDKEKGDSFDEAPTLKESELLLLQR